MGVLCRADCSENEALYNRDIMRLLARSMSVLLIVER